MGPLANRRERRVLRDDKSFWASGALLRSVGKNGMQAHIIPTSISTVLENCEHCAV